MTSILQREQLNRPSNENRIRGVIHLNPEDYYKASRIIGVDGLQLLIKAGEVVVY